MAWKKINAEAEEPACLPKALKRKEREHVGGCALTLNPAV
jgi:hypothetical protein